MKTARRTFLTALFQALEREGVPYCVLRNYEEIYDDASSDVDLAVEPEDIERLTDSLEEAAKASDYRFVHRARYINHSFVYWHPTEGFIRVDFETEVRWRIFLVLTAKSVIGLRRKMGVFYIPHPRHESVILFVAIIWRGQVSQRYRAQLARLYEQLANGEELRRTFSSTFGSSGERLAAYQAGILAEEPPSGLWNAAKWSIARNAFRDAPSRRALWRYLVQDVSRLRERIRQPSGISLLYASSGQPSGKIDQLLQRIEFLYPTKKSVMHSFNIARNEKQVARLSVGLKMERLRTLFKGGLFLRLYQVEDSQIQTVLKSHARYLYPSRTFVVAEAPRFGVVLAHVESGFMAEFEPANGTRSSSDAVIQFISAILERRRLTEKEKRKTRGAFVVLVGLDGSGKTTVARKICCRVAGRSSFRQVRYFHWQPKITKETLFPLPDLTEVRRKAPEKRNMARSLLSALRLFKNVVLVNLAYWIRTGPLLRRGTLILVDRYYYNYFLDPVSVKYYGPGRLLERARSLFPRPDLVVVLKAPATTLLGRKQELSAEEVRSQNEILEGMRFEAREVFEVDAGRPPEELADMILDRLAGGVQIRAPRPMADSTVEN